MRRLVIMMAIHYAERLILTMLKKTELRWSLLRHDFYHRDRVLFADVTCSDGVVTDLTDDNDGNYNVAIL